VICETLCKNIFILLFRRAVVFTFPSNLRRYMALFVTTVLMSIIQGAIFWNVRTANPAEQEDVNDRLALHYVLGSVALWPTLMLMITHAWRDKDTIVRDIRDRLYSRFVYFVAEVLLIFNKLTFFFCPFPSSFIDI